LRFNPYRIKSDLMVIRRIHKKVHTGMQTGRHTDDTSEQAGRTT